MPRLGQFKAHIGLDVDDSLGSLDGYFWTDVTDYALEASYRWGRDRFIHGDFETGLATLTLNNDTGEWSPTSGVNEIGGEKLRPGMLVRFAFGQTAAQLETWLEAVTGDAWAQGTVAAGPDAGQTYVKRDLAASETWTGSVDGCGWTNH